MTDLSCDLGFIKLKNPVIAASGTFGYGLEFAPFMDLNKLGGFVVKGLYFSSREGNPPPRIAETPGGMINAIGLQGIGVKKFAQTILPELKKYKTSVFINVCGEDEEEYERVVDYLNGFEGITAYELNISCPNVKKGGVCPAQDARATYSVVRRVKKISRYPIITKLSPNVTDIVEIAQSAEEAGSDGLSLVNTFLAMSIDIDTRKTRIANVFGGLSGPAIKPLALRMVYQVSQAVGIPVIGLGGITTGGDAIEFLLAGASAVQVGTANFIEPDVTLRILREMETYCINKKIGRIGDIIGKVQI